MDDQKSTAQLFQERQKRVEVAAKLGVPDRVPISGAFSYFPAKYTGLTCEDAFYNPEKWLAACKKTVLDFAPDLYIVELGYPGKVYEALGDKQLLVPGHGVPSNVSHQYVEAERMNSEEFDTFLKDPSDFAFRYYLPRIYSKLNAFSKLPALQNIFYGFPEVASFAIFAKPEFKEALEALAEAGREAEKWIQIAGKFGLEMESLGFPSYVGGVTLAPYDLLPDLLRGMRGSMLDLYRQPDKVLEACEKILLPLCIQKGVEGAETRKNKRVFIPLHRGAEGFMSIKQFETFYWPTFKKLLLALIDAGLTPQPFFEGDYTSRLEYLLEIPKGKMIGHFDTTDLFKAKEIIGNHVCILGNIPASILQTGSPQEVKDYTKKLIDVVGKNGGYIMGCRGPLDEANPELVKVWIEYTKEYGVYR